VSSVGSTPDAITAGSRGEERVANGQQRLAFVWAGTQRQQRWRSGGRLAHRRVYPHERQLGDTGPMTMQVPSPPARLATGVLRSLGRTLSAAIQLIFDLLRQLVCGPFLISVEIGR
jgi:hypothetical protein